MAWLLRFIQYFKNKAIPSASLRMITLTEMRVSQVSSNSKLAALSPILIDDVIRVGGRIRNASLSLGATHPMILPKEHHVSTLILRYKHQILGHAGREHVLSFVCRQYWILQGGALTHKILRNCVTC